MEWHCNVYKYGIIAFVTCGIKNGFNIDSSLTDIFLQFLCLLVTGLHIAFVTCTITVLLQSGFKSVLIVFVRYLIFGFLWVSMASNIETSCRIQYLVADPINCVLTVFAQGLVMDNYGIMFVIVCLSFVVNVGIWLSIVHIADLRGDD